jgi:predicted amino acid-binding ACT domain protein
MRAIVTVIEKTGFGIIADVSAVLAAHGANILVISQTVLQEFFHHDHAHRFVEMPFVVCRALGNT